MDNQIKKRYLGIPRWCYIVAATLILFVVFTLILLNIDTVGEIRYRQSTFGSGAIFMSNSWLEHAIDWRYYEFEDAKTAITTFFEAGITPQNFQEIIKFEEGSYSFIFIPGYITDRPFFRPPPPTLYSFMFMENENGMLTPVYMWAHGIEALFYDTRGIWYDEDRVARDIVMAYVQKGVTSRVNGNIPLYYGVGVGPPPNYIFILGEEPDRIIPFEFSGEEYFFWYFTESSHFGEILSENIDISLSFTLAEIIDLFHIRVGR